MKVGAVFKLPYRAAAGSAAFKPYLAFSLSVTPNPSFKRTASPPLNSNVRRQSSRATKEVAMPDAPVFFVPAATAETQESVYADFAKWCSVSVPPPGRRVASIVFKHNGEVWHATVGETMRGTKYSTHKVKGQKVERSQSLSDPALVLAIFPGSTFMVVTNHRLVGNVGSRWENPFLAGQPESTTFFAGRP